MAMQCLVSYTLVQEKVDRLSKSMVFSDMMGAQLVSVYLSKR